MSTILASKHKLKDGEPDLFDRNRHVRLALQYKVNNGNFLFSYKIASAPEPEDLDAQFEQMNWSQFFTSRDLVADLDIEIRGDSLVRVDTVGPNLFWSLANDAVMTRDDHSSLYGELRYWNGDQWKKRASFNQPSCSRIKFKAKHNLGGPDNERHKFSYNVFLRDQHGEMVEHEIDPDIQNPKV